MGLGQAREGVSAKRSRRQALSEFKDAGGDVQPQVAAAKQFGHRAKFRLRQERRAMALDMLLFDASGAHILGQLYSNDTHIVKVKTMGRPLTDPLTNRQSAIAVMAGGRRGFGLFADWFPQRLDVFLRQLIRGAALQHRLKLGQRLGVFLLARQSEAQVHPRLE